MVRGSSPKSPGRRVRMIFLVYSIVSLFNCMVVYCCSCSAAKYEVPSANSTTVFTAAVKS